MQWPPFSSSTLIAMSVNYKSSINYLKPLRSIANILAIVPPNNIVQIKYKCVAYRFYSFIIFCCFVSAYIFSVIAKRSMMYAKLFDTIIVMDILSDVALELMILMTIYKSATKMKEFQYTKQLFEELDKILNFKTTSNIQRRFYIEFVISHIFVIVLIFYDIIMSVDTLDYSFVFLLREIGEYYNFIFVLVTYNYILSVKMRITNFNDYLKDKVKFLISSKSGLAEICVSNESGKSKIDTIVEMRAIYSKICKFVDMFNIIYGWQILILTATICIGLLEVLNLGIFVLTHPNGFYEVFPDKTILAFFALSWFGILLVSLYLWSITWCQNFNRSSIKVGDVIPDQDAIPDHLQGFSY